MKPLVISFFTNDWEYPKCAKNMIRRCNQLKLEHHIVEQPSFKNYIKNTTIKPKFINDTMKKFDRPLLWVDVDGKLLKEPIATNDISTDFAGCEYFNKNLDRDWSVSIMWFNNTPNAKKLLDRWCELAGPGGTDEGAFDDAWKQLKGEVSATILPPQYHFVYWSHKLKIPRDTVFCNQLSQWEDKLRRKVNGVLIESDDTDYHD